MPALTQNLRARLRIAISMLRRRGGAFEANLAGRLEKILRYRGKKPAPFIGSRLTVADFNWLQARAKGLKVAALAFNKQKGVRWAKQLGKDLKDEVAALRHLQDTVRHLWNVGK